VFNEPRQLTLDHLSYLVGEGGHLVSDRAKAWTNSCLACASMIESSRRCRSVNPASSSGMAGCPFPVLVDEPRIELCTVTT
jgi:hypothetical protein